MATASGNDALSSQLYPPDVMHPDGARRIIGFTNEPWPKWIFALEDGARIEQELFAVHGEPIVVTWRMSNPGRWRNSFGSIGSFSPNDREMEYWSAGSRNHPITPLLHHSNSPVRFRNYPPATGI